MRIVIVDDEAPARRRMRRMLERIPGCDVVAEADNGADAIAIAEALAPDLTLLDIHMPQLEGLAAAASIRFGKVVFVTAHDEHAIKAFELGALDYLLKPVSQARLEAAIARARQSPAAAEVDLAAVVARVIGREPRARPRLTARVGSTIRVFDPLSVRRLTASDKYTVLISDGEEFILDESLGELEARLLPDEFVRVHRAELVNLKHVVALHVSGSSATLEMNDGQSVPVSRRHLPDLKRRLKGDAPPPQ